MALYDQINAINSDQIQRGLSPLVDIGRNKAQFAAIQLARQRELEDQASKALLAQKLLDQQEQYQTIRDANQRRQSMEIIREQNRLIGERQAADDERAYRKAVEAEAFRYGVDSKGVSTDDLIKQLDDKIAATVKSDLKKRKDLEGNIIKLMSQSSLASRERIRAAALNDPALLASMKPETVQALRERKTTIEDVITNMAKRGIGNPFIAGAKDAKAAYDLYAQALQRATETDKATNPDFALSIRLGNLNNDLQILDSNIGESFKRIRNVDKAKGIFENELPAVSPGVGPMNPSNPLLQGIPLPPPKPITNVQPLPPPVSTTGEVVPNGPGVSLPYVQEYPYSP